MKLITPTAALPPPIKFMRQTPLLVTVSIVVTVTLLPQQEEPAGGSNVQPLPHCTVLGEGQTTTMFVHGGLHTTSVMGTVRLVASPHALVTVRMTLVSAHRVVPGGMLWV